MMRQVADALTNASGMPARQIEQELLPLWESRWLSECPLGLNKTAIGEYVERTVRGCPVYRQTLEQLKGLRGELRSRVAEAHRALEDGSKLREHGERRRQDCGGPARYTAVLYSPVSRPMCCCRAFRCGLAGAASGGRGPKSGAQGCPEFRAGMDAQSSEDGPARDSQSRGSRETRHRRNQISFKSWQ